MTKSLSIASVIEKNRLSSDVPWLICIDVGVIDPKTTELVETLHYVLNNEEVVFNGFTYQPASFDIEIKEESGTQQSVSLSFRDYTLVVQSKMQAYAGGVGFTVALSVVNSGALSQPPEVVEYFQVTAAESSNYACSFTLGAENTLARTFPRRRQIRDFCQFRYKGKDCGYTGTKASCDLSLGGANGCKAHNNTVRFGGFPGISSKDARYG